MFSVTESTGYGTMVDICLGMVGSGKEVILAGEKPYCCLEVFCVL